jgi:hypothetical protein
MILARLPSATVPTVENKLMKRPISQLLSTYKAESVVSADFSLIDFQFTQAILSSNFLALNNR